MTNDGRRLIRPHSSPPALGKGGVRGGKAKKITALPSICWVVMGRWLEGVEVSIDPDGGREVPREGSQDFGDEHPDAIWVPWVFLVDDPELNES